MPGTLFVVATPIGNLEDISARALRVLRESALIAAEDTRRIRQLLVRYGIDTATTSLHEHNEHAKTAALIDKLRSGQDIALVSDAGTPGVSDPGQHLIQEAQSAGIRLEPVPGPSAALAALSVCGLSTQFVCFAGFPPTGPSDRRTWFRRVQTCGGTVVFFEAPHRIRTTLEDFGRMFGDVEVFLGRELTKMHETLVKGPISTVVQGLTSPVGEYTAVINIGRSTNITADDAAGSGDEAERLARAVRDFGDLTNTKGFTRRRAISELARRYGLQARAIYAAIEVAKKSVD